jgi:acetolactate synthase I/II/III large subunit
MRVYEAIIKGLEGIGVDAAFGGAGENAASLLLALKHSSKIKPVIVRHEQAASFMACGYAIYSNRLGVCFATAGPGAFNLFSGLAAAMSDSYPVLGRRDGPAGTVSPHPHGRACVTHLSRSRRWALAHR